MTIREIQELLKLTDEKVGKISRVGSDTSQYDICKRFCEVVNDANAGGIDLTEAMVEWLDNERV